MSEIETTERTADDILKQLESMDGSSSDGTVQDAPEVKPEETAVDGNQSPVAESTEAPKAENEAKPLKEGEDFQQVDDAGKPLSKEEKREYTFAEMRKKIAELEEKLSSSQQATAQAQPETSNAPKAEQEATPKVTADEVLDVYSRAKTGDLTADELELIGSERQAIELCEKLLSEKLSASDIFAARQKMAASSNSDAVELATKFLPVAQQRERMESDRVQAEWNSYQAQHNAELDKIRSEYPEITKKDSPLAKYAVEWDAAHLTQFGQKGEVVKQGKLSAEMSRYLILHPLEHVAMVKSYFDQVSVAKGSEANLKKKLALSQSPESGSPPAGQVNKGRTADDVLRDLENLSAKPASAY